MVYLIGTGNMGREYTKVLQSLHEDFIVIGRSEQSAEAFAAATKVIPRTGGLNAYLNGNTSLRGSKVIIATGTENLMPVLKKVLVNGASSVLIEKPGAISIEELLENEQFLKRYADKIFIAYNRRFYSSVFECERLIKEDGGLKTVHFEFTEWVHVIDKINAAPGAKENLFFGNSTHVIDLAFFFAGKPSIWNGYSQSGSISWHDKTNFVGAGISENNVLFSYMSNWESAGRWGIELLTKSRRIYLSPLEKIRIQTKGSLTQENHLFDDRLDNEFKPGLCLQVEAFLRDDYSRFSNVLDQIKSSRSIYLKMLG